MCTLVGQEYIYLENGKASQPEAAIWNADGLFVCPLMGMGLTELEQRKLLRKYSPDAATSLNRYDVHELFVKACESKNPFSEGINKLIHKKFEQKSVPLRQLPEEAFCLSWDKAFQEGNCCAHLWALSTAPHFSSDTRRKVYGDIHMASHAFAEEKVSLKQKIAEAQKENQKNLQQIESLRRELNFLRQQKRSVNAEDRQCPSSMQQVNTVAEQYRVELQADYAAMKEKNRQLQQDLEESNTLVQALARIAEQKAAVCCQGKCCQCCSSDCPSFNLCQKRILIVGGLSRMESLYRALVEGSGGILDYHDGVMQGGSRQLERNLQRADIVVCPVSCNSHGACRMVKNLAKKYRKRFYMIPTASLTAIGGVLARHGLDGTEESSLEQPLAQ